MRRMEISRACCPCAGRKPELKTLAEKSENEESLGRCVLPLEIQTWEELELVEYIDKLVEGGAQSPGCFVKIPSLSLGFSVVAAT